MRIRTRVGGSCTDAGQRIMSQQVEEDDCLETTTIRSPSVSTYLSDPSICPYEEWLYDVYSVRSIGDDC